MLSLIFVSGNPLFPKQYLLPLFFLVLFYFFNKRRTFDKSFILFVGFLAIVFLFQFIAFNNFPFLSISGVFVRLLIAYFVLKILDKNFIRIYINIFYYLAIISLLLFLIINTFPYTYTFLLNHSFVTSNSIYSRHSIIFYTIIANSGLFFRNSGPFWEAGAFGGYLIIALIFNYIKNGVFFNRKGIVLLMALLSTTSTTVYIALFVFLYFLALKSKINIIYKFILLIFVVFISFYLYTNVSFIGEKISSQIESAESSSIHTNTNSQRFLSVLRDFEDIKGHYFWGRGPLLKNRYNVWSSSDTRTNGFTDFWVRFGSLFFILSFIYLFISFKKTNCYFKSRFTSASFIIILLMLQSETYFNYPMFWSLFFLGNIYNCNDNRKYINSILFNNNAIIQ